MILISHNMEHVMQVADRAVVLRQGTLRRRGDPDAEHHEQIVAMIVGSGRDEESEASEATDKPTARMAIASATAGATAAADADGEDAR